MPCYPAVLHVLILLILNFDDVEDVLHMIAEVLTISRAQTILPSTPITDSIRHSITCMSSKNSVCLVVQMLRIYYDFKHKWKTLVWMESQGLNSIRWVVSYCRL